MTFFRHIKTEFAFLLMHLPMRGQWRPVFAKWGGVQVLGKHCFIGRGVHFDSVAPNLITIGKHVHITEGCTILTHYLDTNSSGIHWRFGKVQIEDNVFIGTNTIICKPCSIGENVIIGAGSVVTKDIPANEIWGGNPAHFIKERCFKMDQ